MENNFCGRANIDTWLACHSGSEIAAAVGLSEGEISKSVSSFQAADLPDGNKAAASHATDFDIPPATLVRIHAIDREAALVASEQAAWGAWP